MHVRFNGPLNFSRTGKITSLIFEHFLAKPPTGAVGLLCALVSRYRYLRRHLTSGRAEGRQRETDRRTDGTVIAVTQPASAA